MTKPKASPTSSWCQSTLASLLAQHPEFRGFPCALCLIRDRLVPATRILDTTGAGRCDQCYRRFGSPTERRRKRREGVQKRKRAEQR